jgi:3-isopropylmalate dehydrogenase
MFEPIHGSAPKYKGQNKVNPIATIWAGAMLIEQMGEKEAADAIVSAIETNISEAKVQTYDMGGSAGTSDVGDDIARIVLGK